MTNYLLRYIDTTGEYKILTGNESVDLLGVIFGQGTNIVTTHGPNALDSVSGYLQDEIDTLSAASSAALVSVSGTLQSEIDAITSDFAKEERFEAVSGQTLFTLSSIIFDATPSRRDIVVYKNGVRAFMSTSGLVSGVTTGGDWQKVGTTQVQFLYGLRDGDRVIVRDERTGGGGGGGGSTDLENIDVNPQPDTNGARSLGIVTKAWKNVFLKDTVTSQVYRVEVISGVLQATLVP